MILSVNQFHLQFHARVLLLVCAARSWLWLLWGLGACMACDSGSSGFLDLSTVVFFNDCSYADRGFDEDFYACGLEGAKSVGSDVAGYYGGGLFVYGGLGGGLHDNFSTS